MKSILFAATEATPYVKSGGLADVVGSLPQELVKNGVDVRVVLPLFLRVAEQYRDQAEELATFPIRYGQFESVCTVYKKEVDQVTFYFVQHAGYFEREGLYGYPDDGERFAFYQRAILDMLDKLNYFPDIIHSHDWHTGMIPFLAKELYKQDKRYAKIKHVYTIHNLAYQGNFPKEVLGSCFGVPDQYYDNGSLRLHNGISFMKAGIVYADIITTVSPTYAKEILTPQFGENLDEVLKFREQDLYGITNGIDLEYWNPEIDPNLVENYSKTNVIKGKIANKLSLQKELGLRETKEVMVVGMVSRLVWQKGVYLILEKMAEIMGQDIQLIILGTGEPHVENQLRQIEDKYHRRAVYYGAYNEELAHRIYAGSDLFLMPSLFEPCGISQLISERYGTIPLVREVGGLKDTIIPVNEYTGEGTGFTFSLFTGQDMVHILKYATDVYYTNRTLWKKLIKNAMESDVSWEKSAAEYIKLYSKLKK